MKKLTPKQQRFCQQYVIDFNASRAARDAGYKSHAARAMGCENLQKPAVAARIRELQASTEADYKISRAKVLQGIQEIAENGESEAIRLRALDLLGKHIGIYNETNRQKKPDLVNVVDVVIHKSYVDEHS